MNRKEILLDLIQQASAMLQDFGMNLSSEERIQVGTLESWSAKDVIAHVAAWNEHMAANLSADSQGREPIHTDDFDHENAVLFAKYQDWSWDAVLALAAQAHQQIVDQIAALGEPELDSLELLPWQDDRPLWRLVIGTAYIHPVMHLAEYLRNQGARTQAGELLGTMTQAMVDLDPDERWQGVVKYNLACHYALLGDHDNALDTLKGALILRPDLKEWSQQDPDLESLRSDSAYLALYE